ncbi:MAG: hypothetical protein RLZZ11_606 [Cyanobacteriota bacterium]
MPSVRFEESWVPGFRSAVRTSTAEGWSVREHRGGMRLQVRHAAGSMQTVSLPFDWARRSTGDALVRIRNIYALVEEGHSIRSAADSRGGRPLSGFASRRSCTAMRSSRAPGRRTTSR